jgi:hypothetical protein
MAKKATKRASLTETSRHLDVSREAIRRLEASGVLRQEAGGGFDLDETRLAYIRHLRERPMKSAKRERLYEVQTELREHELAVRRHDYVKLKDYEETYKFLVMAVRSIAYAMGNSLIMTLNARTDRDTRHLIDTHINRYLHAVAAFAEWQDQSLANRGEVDLSRAPDTFFTNAPTDFPEAGLWLPPSPAPTLHHGTDHYNSWIYIAWRAKLGILAAPHRSDAELAEFLTIADPAVAEALGTVVSDLAVVAPEVVAKVRREEAKSIAGVRSAIDADKARRDACKARRANGGAVGAA